MMQQHEAMDMILKYLIDNKSDTPIHSYTIWKDLFADLSIEEEVVYFMLKKIMSTNDEIVIAKVRSDSLDNFEVFFDATPITKSFLNNQGGFSKQYENEQKEKIEEMRLALLNAEKLESEVDIIRFQKGLGKRLTIWGFGFAVVSFLVSYLTGLYQNASSQDYVLKVDSLNKVILTTNNRVDYLNDSLQSLNLRLRTIEQQRTQTKLKGN